MSHNHRRGQNRLPDKDQHNGPTNFLSIPARNLVVYDVEGAVGPCFENDGTGVEKTLLELGGFQITRENVTELGAGKTANELAERIGKLITEKITEELPPQPAADERVYELAAAQCAMVARRESTKAT
ncbi:hypothetical protein N7G274_002343 [Stereocaulon virgatum]|uniref:Uncharacterized protein n=1 Tax=Stereocaulon virgatum TaxID=373712 RepID=A0ABR4AHN7_9LECA